MKIHLHIENDLQQIEVNIHAPEYTEAVKQLMKKLNQLPMPPTIAGYWDGDIHNYKKTEVNLID